jgi:hypothetical protein
VIPADTATRPQPRKCAGHRRLAAAAERKAVDRCDDGLAQILDEVENALPESAGLLRFEAGDVRELADIRSGNERFVARAGKNDAVNGAIVARGFKR